jgi:hypothetical protein
LVIKKMKGSEAIDKRQDGHRHPRANFGRGRGRSGTSPQTPHAPKSEAFKGIESTLPVLNYGGPHKDNRPIEFLASMGEYTGVKYKSTIAPAFWNIPPAFGPFEIEPVAPMPIGNQPTCTIRIQEYMDKCIFVVETDVLNLRIFSTPLILLESTVGT